MRIKRFLATILILALVIFSLMGVLTACGEDAECDGCGKEAKLKTVNVPFLGKMDLCSDCADEVKDLK